jgi:hypothetical protein
MSRVIHFYATKQDLIQMAIAVELEVSLQYTKADHLECPELVIYKSLYVIPDLCNFEGKGSNIISQYLVLSRDIKISHRVIKLKKGGLRYVIDQVKNPQSIVLDTGKTNKQVNMMLPGAVGTTSEDPASLELFKVFSRTIRKNWEKIKSYYVGPEAVAVLDSGGRLAIGINSPEIYDLKR